MICKKEHDKKSSQVQARDEGKAAMISYQPHTRGGVQREMATGGGKAAMRGYRIIFE